MSIAITFPKEHEKYIQKIGKTADEMGINAYIVGGYVRDLILKRPCKDIDIVCVGSGIELAERAARQFKEATEVAVFKNFGTAMFSLRQSELEFEFVGARKESYQTNSRKPTVENGSLEDDQLRRDFTINALALGINAHNYGQLLDSFGGIADLEKRILRTPTNPDITFSDDPLRMLRAIRFATQLQFIIDAPTYDAIIRNNSRLNIISGERIRDELNKIIAAPRPSIGFKLLFNTGLLQQFFPEMAALQGVEIRDGVGHKDNFYHTLQVLDNLAAMTDSLWLRWAALLHDIAKPVTKRFEDNSWTFHGHEALGAKWVPRIFDRLRLPLDDRMRFVQKMVAMHQRPVGLTKAGISDSALRRLMFDAGEDIDSLMLLCKADITSRNEERVQRYLESYNIMMQNIADLEARDHLRNWQPPIDGTIIMQTFALKPGKEVGEIKTAIREAILDGAIANNYEEAHAFMLEKGREMGLSSIHTNK